MGAATSSAHAVCLPFFPLSHRECSRAYTLALSATSNSVVSSSMTSKDKKKDKHNAIAQAAFEASVVALKVTKEASGALPPLQATAAGLLVIADIISVRCCTHSASRSAN